MTFAALGRWAIFGLGALFIVVLSRRSLRDPRSHGFWRVFAFEALLGLLLVAVGRWFVDPLSPRQVASWVLLAVSLALAVWGFLLLVLAGKPRGGVEGTTTLVTSGIYRYIRHPLYSSLLFLAWGAFLKAPAPASATLAVLASAALVATARAEERENTAKFGEAYTRYMRATKRFLPLVF